MNAPAPRSAEDHGTRMFKTAATRGGCSACVPAGCGALPVAVRVRHGRDDGQCEDGGRVQSVARVAAPGSRGSRVTASHQGMFFSRPVPKLLLLDMGSPSLGWAGGPARAG